MSFKPLQLSAESCIRIRPRKSYRFISSPGYGFTRRPRAGDYNYSCSRETLILDFRVEFAVSSFESDPHLLKRKTSLEQSHSQR